MLYYELLRPNETVTTDRYQQQLWRLSDELTQKGSYVANNRRKVILLHDNACCEKREANFYNLNGKSSHIQRILQM